MNLTEISTIKALCSEFGFGFKKKYGQNFLISNEIPSKIAENASGCCALEIGPGFGTLTKALCETCEKVVSLEIDASLAPVLEATVGEYKNLKVIFSDVMKTDISELYSEEFEGKRLPFALICRII